MNEPLSPPIIDIAQFKESLKTKSVDELKDMISEIGEKAAVLIGLHVEARIRLHECQYHGRENEEAVTDLLGKSGESLTSILKALAR